MNEAPGLAGGGAPTPVQADVDRIEALEQQVRQLTSRLAGWVEAQLVQAVDDRRNDMKTFRSELQLVITEQLAGMRAEASSVLTVATRRLEVAQEQLSERLDRVAEQASASASQAVALGGAMSAEDDRYAMLEQKVGQRLAALEGLRDDITALKTEAHAGPARIEAFEQRVKAAIARLTDSVEKRLAETGADGEAGFGALRLELTEAMRQQVVAAAAAQRESVDARLAELATAQATGIEGLRAELAAATAELGERVESADRGTTAVTESVTGLRADAEAATARTDELEQRVKAAVGRLAESVETRLADVAAGQSAELRDGLDIVATALRARLAEIQERVEAVEQQGRDSDGRVNAVAETRLGDALKEELEAALAGQLREARAEIGTVVADAHRRFVVSVDQLHERMNVVADQATAAHAAATRIETLQETLTSDGRRIEALEVHTRRTDARLGDVVEAKLSEHRGAALDGAQEQLRAALDAHLTETRAEVTLALGEGRQELIDGVARLEDRQAAIDRQAAEAAARLEERLAAYDRQVADAAAGLEAIDASVGTGLREAEERLRKAVETRLAAIEGVAAELAEGRTELASTVASVTRKMARVQDQVQRKVATVVEQVDGMARAAAMEAGALAPLRSDVRMLQAQVAELTELATSLRPVRKAAAPAKKAVIKKAATRKAPAAPARKKAAVALVKKAPPASPKKAVAPVAKGGRPRRAQ